MELDSLEGSFQCLESAEAAVAVTTLRVRGAEPQVVVVLIAPLDLPAEATLKIKRTTSKASKCTTKRKRVKSDFKIWIHKTFDYIFIFLYFNKDYILFFSY